MKKLSTEYGGTRAILKVRSAFSLGSDGSDLMQCKSNVHYVSLCSEHGLLEDSGKVIPTSIVLEEER